MCLWARSVKICTFKMTDSPWARGHLEAVAQLDVVAEDALDVGRVQRADLAGSGLQC
jgi:hypothetical protein